MYDPFDRRQAPATLFGLLSGHKSLGKKVDLLVDVDDAGSLVNPANVNALELRGPDEAAQNVQLVIGPPRVIPVTGSLGNFPIETARAAAESQNASGAELVDVLSHFGATPIVANIEWGVGGVAIKSALVDVSNGLCVNLTCSFLRVGFQVDPLVSILSLHAGSSAVYELEAFVGQGWARPGSAQRTLPLGQVGAISLPTIQGTSVIVPVPRFATRVKLSCGLNEFTDPLSAMGWVCQLAFFDSAMNSLYMSNTDPAFWDSVRAVNLVTDNGNAQGDGFPVPNGAYYCAVVNRSAITLRPILTFELAI